MVSSKLSKIPTLIVYPENRGFGYFFEDFFRKSAEVSIPIQMLLDFFNGQLENRGPKADSVDTG